MGIHDYTPFAYDVIPQGSPAFVNQSPSIAAAMPGSVFGFFPWGRAQALARFLSSQGLELCAAAVPKQGLSGLRFKSRFRSQGRSTEHGFFTEHLDTWTVKLRAGGGVELRSVQALSVSCGADSDRGKRYQLLESSRSPGQTSLAELCWEVLTYQVFLQDTMSL